MPCGGCVGGASYVVRIDDLCATLRWAVWDRVEALLLRYGVSPLLAVIPDNQDRELMLDKPREDFWERVRDWQARGWTIAMHGYQHRYVNRESGLLGLNPRSEFAGLPRAAQREKLERGLEIFRKNGVRAEAWIAPSHSFDGTTLDLLAELGIPWVSDGMTPHPFTDARGLVWVPCQAWDFVEKTHGVWTVCLHPNEWDRRDLRAFEAGLERFGSRILPFPRAIVRGLDRRLSLLDRLEGQVNLQWRWRLRPRVARCARAALAGLKASVWKEEGRTLIPKPPVGSELCSDTTWGGKGGHSQA